MASLNSAIPEAYPFSTIRLFQCAFLQLSSPQATAADSWKLSTDVLHWKKF